MISDTCKCVFVHIPKAAGQSIEQFFLSLHGLDWEGRAELLMKFNPDPQRGPERLAHLKAAEYVKFGYMNQDSFTEYFKFAFVRNPWARLVSEFLFRGHSSKLSFKEFVMNGLPEESDYNDEARHIIPQYDFLYDDQGRLLVDFVGRFERLQEDFDLVCERLGINESKLPHRNASKNHKISLKSKVKSWIKSPQKIEKPHYTEFYDEETLAAVNNMYAKDISVFDYRFGD